MPLQSAMPSAGAVTVAGRVLEVSGQGEELLFMLFPHLRGLRVGQVEDTGDAVVIRASCRAAQARCPLCGAVSSRVHGGYARVVADGAAGGRPVLIALSVRRFRCPEPSCPKVTFAEQAGGVSVRYRRRSVPLLGMLAGFGLELAGRAGARLAGTLGVPVHSSTVLRLVMALPDPPVTAAPEVTGVDDFALRKGHVYGTVVADAESGDVIDLLPDREAATLREWLKAHPGAEVICRDRAGAYAEGARDGAPGAIQVADRWHLWHNLAEYAEKTVTRHRGCLKEQPAADAAGDEDTPAVPDGSLDVCGRERQMARRTRERYAEIRQRLDAGQPEAAIRRATGLDRRTVQKYARAASADELVGRHEPGIEAGRVQAVHLPAVEPGPHRRLPDPRRAPAARLGRQPADRPPVRPPAPAGRAGSHARPGRAENPRDHPLAAVTPWQPRRRRPGPARRGQALPAPGRPGRAHPGLRRHDDPPPGPARTRRLAHPGRGRRPARTPLTRRRHPARPAGRHRRAGPALPLRRHGGKRQQDQDDQTPDVRPRWLRPPP